MKPCENCKYYKDLNSSWNLKCCHYILIEKRPRNCDADNCKKFQPIRGQRRLVATDDAFEWQHE